MRNKTKKQIQTKEHKNSKGMRVDLAVQSLEFLWGEYNQDYNYDNFMQYMNKNNIWDIMNNKDLLGGLIWAEFEDIVRVFGNALPKEEQTRMINRYHKQVF